MSTTHEFDEADFTTAGIQSGKLEIAGWDIDLGTSVRIDAKLLIGGQWVEVSGGSLTGTTAMDLTPGIGAITTFSLAGTTTINEFTSTLTPLLSYWFYIDRNGQNISFADSSITKIIYVLNGSNDVNSVMYGKVTYVGNNGTQNVYIVEAFAYLP